MIYFSVFCISVSLLALEITWMRLLSFQQWSHVASAVITLAMLGFAASGAYLAWFQGFVRRAWQQHYGLLALLYAGSIPWSYYGLQALPLDPFMAVWDPRQGLVLLGYSFLLFVPFLLGAGSIGILFCAEELTVGQVYFANLLGSALGVLAAMGLLLVGSLQTTLASITVTGILGALAALRAREGGWRAACVLLMAVVLSVPLVLTQPIRMAPNKPLARTLRMPGTRTAEERTSPWGLVQVLEGPSLRSLPGLSLRYTGDIPAGSMVFVDGDSVGLRVSAQTALREPLDFFRQTIQAAGYQALERPDIHVLVLGAGGGAGVLQALEHGAQRVTLVEQHPVILDQTRQWLERFAGKRFPGKEVVCRASDARRFLEDHRERFDLIVLDGLGSPTAAFGGTNAFQGDYLLTTEGVGQLFDHLWPETGVLAFTCWAHVPPRETFKLISTLVEVCTSHGIPDPGEHLFVLRGWSACTTLAFRSPLSAPKIQALRSFCFRNDFDLVYHPGLGPDEVNRKHRLEQPYYFDGVTALLGKRAASFQDDYLFFIRPACDTKPYFHRFFKWRAFPVLWKELGREWILLREWGYVALWLTLVVACFLGGVFLLPPVFFSGRGGRRQPEALSSRGPWRAYVFFGCLGAAFMCYEMSFIEQFTFFLSYPLLSVSAVLSAILLFSSLGSLVAARCSGKEMHRSILLKSCFVLAGLGAGYAVGLMALLRPLLGCGLWVRGVIAILLLAPPCFLMGIPFPTVLSWIRERRAREVPLCWGINGWASVVATALTPLLAMHTGLPGAVSIGAGLYCLAGCLAMTMGKGIGTKSG